MGTGIENQEDVDEAGSEANRSDSAAKTTCQDGGGERYASLAPARIDALRSLIDEVDHDDLVDQARLHRLHAEVFTAFAEFASGVPACEEAD